MHSDTPADRHTPRDGLWHAHLGWLVRYCRPHGKLDPEPCNVLQPCSCAMSACSLDVIISRRQLTCIFLQFDEQLAGTRVDSRGNMKDALSAPWFYKCGPAAAVHHCRIR